MNKSENENTVILDLRWFFLGILGLVVFACALSSSSVWLAGLIEKSDKMQSPTEFVEVDPDWGEAQRIRQIALVWRVRRMAPIADPYGNIKGYDCILESITASRPPQRWALSIDARSAFFSHWQVVCTNDTITLGFISEAERMASQPEKMGYYHVSSYLHPEVTMLDNWPPEAEQAGSR